MESARVGTRSGRIGSTPFCSPKSFVAAEPTIVEQRLPWGQALRNPKAGLMKAR